MSPANINLIAQTLFAWLGQWCQVDKQAPPALNVNWSEREWNIAKAVIIIHGMGPTLGYLLKSHDHCDLPTAMQAFLRAQFDENQKRITMISDAKQRISQLLQQHQIDFLTFKGLDIAQSLYPDVNMRPMADIDIYTGQQDPNKLSELFAQIGFQPHVISHEGITLYPTSCTQATLQTLHKINQPNANWQGASASGDDDSLWYQGESAQLPYSIDVHFTMEQGIQEFRYDLNPMFSQALASQQGLSPEQRYIHLLLHASKHFRCHCGRWIQLYDLHLIQQNQELDEAQVLAEAIRYDACHLLLWPLQLTRKIFASEPTWLELQLRQHTSWRYQWLFARHDLATLSHCNPQHMGLLYGLLWTQHLSKISQWLRLSSQSNDTDFKRDNQQLTRSPPILKRMVTRLVEHFNPKAREQWHIFALQGLAPKQDWKDSK